MSGSEKICGILLAAGVGSRFGGDKLLHPLGDGTPLGVVAWRHLQRALPRSIVVIRPDQPALHSMYSAEGARVLVCADAAQGMGHSLACGIAGTRDAAGWVVALADMPSVKTHTIKAIAAELARGASIVVPTYRGERGHPVAFESRHRDALLELSGDVGARALLERHADHVVRLAVDDPGILQDVDTRDQAARVIQAGLPG
jgi:molybdenum cofactor cytidylyltransferase